MDYIREGKHLANGRDRTGWINLNFMQQSQMNQSNCMENFCLNYDFLNKINFQQKYFQSSVVIDKKFEHKKRSLDAPALINFAESCFENNLLCPHVM